MYTVYAMRSKWKNYIYVGMNLDLLGYLKRHNDGREKTTRPNRPIELIYKEFQLPRKDARSREKYFKFGLGKEFLRRIS
ncbi:MAG: GIY-YIG nuclease family protein [bacterium]|nr:GIY-YIG nuclease family protein [bacterium]